MQSLRAADDRFHRGGAAWPHERKARQQSRHGGWPQDWFATHAIARPPTPRLRGQQSLISLPLW
jgi:hypothetical protein